MVDGGVIEYSISFFFMVVFLGRTFSPTSHFVFLIFLEGIDFCFFAGATFLSVWFGCVSLTGTADGAA